MTPEDMVGMLTSRIHQQNRALVVALSALVEINSLREAQGSPDLRFNRVRTSYEVAEEMRCIARGAIEDLRAAGELP